MKLYTPICIDCKTQFETASNRKKRCNKCQKAWSKTANKLWRNGEGVGKGHDTELHIDPYFLQRGTISDNSPYTRLEA